MSINRIGKTWEFFENLNEIVYVADVDTYDLIYLNKKTRDAYGVSTDEVSRHKCYELLQNNSAPCSFCTNHLLHEKQFVEWRYYNPIIMRHFQLKDTLINDGGRRCRLEIAIDNTELFHQANIVRNYQNLEKITSEGFRLALNEFSPEKSIQVLLEYLGKALKGERTYIFERNETGGDDNTYEWVAEGVTPQIQNLQGLPPEVCANWYRNFREDRIIAVHDIEEMRENDPLPYEVLKQQNIRSLVVVPLYDGKRLIGFYGVDNPPWGAIDYARTLFQIMAHFIVVCIKRRNLTNELREMSYSDPLTHLGNRFAMDDYLQKIDPEQSLGLVYCDITRLKYTNDTMGHMAGDKLIMAATDAMREAFGGYELYRMGGDELLVLCAGIRREDMDARVSALRAAAEKRNVTLAVGYAWEAKADDVDAMLLEAEKHMYDEKRAYYKATGLSRSSL